MLVILGSEIRTKILQEAFEYSADELSDLTWEGTLDLSEDPVACLGLPKSLLSMFELEGLQPLDPTSFYSTLHRPGNLPGPCRITVKNKQVQELVERFWSGDCQFIVPYKHARISEDFHLKAQIGQEDEGAVITICHHLQGHGGTINKNFDGVISGQLDDDQQQILTCRLLHLFLRQYGFLVGCDRVKAVLNWVGSMWGKSKKFKLENLDCWMLKMDLLCVIPTSCAIGVEREDPPEAIELLRAREREWSPYYDYTMMKVGEALEALGRFEEAAMIYVELAESFRQDQPDEYQALVNAGIAYRRMSDYTESLRHYVLALQSLGKHRTQNWDLNDKQTTEVIIPLVSCLTMRHHLATQTRYDSNNTLAYARDDMLSPSFVCLLGCAGFRPPVDGSVEGGHECQLCLDFWQEDTGTMLKPFFVKRKSARRTLLGAFNAGTLDGFKDRITSAARQNVCITYENPIPKVDSAKIAEMQKSDKKSAQKFVKKESRTDVLCWNCGAHELPNVKHMTCPCKGVFYCGKECQTEHWSEHKPLCRWQLAKKSKSKSGDK